MWEDLMWEDYEVGTDVQVMLASFMRLIVSRDDDCVMLTKMKI